MINFKHLTETVAVAGSLTAADMAGLAADGITSILNVRPDHESADQVGNASLTAAAEAVGLSVTHIPATAFELFCDDVVAPVRAALAPAMAADGDRVLIACASGQRAAILWAAATARTLPVDAVLARLSAAKFDLAFLRDDLEQQADRARWSEDSGAAGIAQPAAEKATRKAA